MFTSLSRCVVSCLWTLACEGVGSGSPSAVVHVERRTDALALVFDSSSFDSAGAQEKGSN